MRDNGPNQAGSLDRRQLLLGGSVLVAGLALRAARRVRCS
jgi:hypothetical protein